MIYPLSILSIFLLFLIHLTSGHPDCAHAKNDTIPFSTRAFWMRRANAVLAYSGSPCPFGAFGTVIVNHTDLSHGPMGREVCVGVNAVRSGNPTLHGRWLLLWAWSVVMGADHESGEIAGINNCSQILTDPKGEYNLTASQVALAWPTLSLYTNAESCPMVLSLSPPSLSSPLTKSKVRVRNPLGRLQREHLWDQHSFPYRQRMVPD